MKRNAGPESVKNIFAELKFYPEWRGRHGPPPKYFFDHLKMNEIMKTACNMKKSRSVQTAILLAAKRQGYFIQTQNHGHYILTKRIK